MRRMYSPTTEAQLILQRIPNAEVEHPSSEEPFGHELVRIRISFRVSGECPSVRKQDLLIDQTEKFVID